MTTVKQLIEYLVTLDPECQVEVLKENSTSFVALDFKYHVYHSTNTCDDIYPHGFLELGEQ